MAISNISATTQPSSVSATTVAARNKPIAISDTQEATVVNLSSQARKLSMAPSTTAQNQIPADTKVTQEKSSQQADKAATAKVEAGAREAAEAPAAQAKENNNRSRINTYA